MPHHPALAFASSMVVRSCLCNPASIQNGDELYASEPWGVMQEVRAVFLDALQIPAGMLQVHRIPVDFTGMELESTGMGLDSSGFQRN